MSKVKFGHVIRRGVSVAASAAVFAASVPVPALAQVDLSKWSPEYVRSIAGTQDYDTAASCGKVTPLDYKGRVINAQEGTAAKVRVSIESTDGDRVWGTVGVSENVIEASWLALADSFHYCLLPT
jgi:hypothetical protein